MGTPFHSKLLNDMYTFGALDGTKATGTASACTSELCCHASYSLPSQESIKNLHWGHLMATMTQKALLSRLVF